LVARAGRLHGDLPRGRARRRPARPPPRLAPGARFAPPPVEYHAWAELPGHGPVGEYTDAGWRHHTALTI
ncbi:hypothetical protein ACFV08_25540, partial [Streptomyces fradiae]